MLQKKLPRQTLVEIVTREKSLYQEPQRCEALLRDLCSGHEREINLLVSALKQGIAAKLLDSQRVTIPYNISSARLIKQLEDTLSLTRVGAKWAVDSWALALGIISDKDATASDKELLLERQPEPFVPPQQSGNSVYVVPQKQPRRGWKWAAFLTLALVSLALIFVVVNKQRQEAMIAQEPFTIRKIELRNESAQGPLSSVTDRFAGKDIRYIKFYLTLQNNAYAVKDFEGDLKVKYLDPDGILNVGPKSPDGYTLSNHFSMPSSMTTMQISGGWGDAQRGHFSIGRWRIEIWWEGRKMGETSFLVY